jgi:Zn-dependent peptidase ImmA (M78 family)
MAGFFLVDLGIGVAYYVAYHRKPSLMSSETPLSKLPDSQVFSRDPEAIDAETAADIERRFVVISERLRRQRGDVAQADQTARAEKAAKKTRKKKAKKAAPLTESETP